MFALNQRLSVFLQNPIMKFQLGRELLDEINEYLEIEIFDIDQKKYLQKIRDDLEKSVNNCVKIMSAPQKTPR